MQFWDSSPSCDLHQCHAPFREGNFSAKVSYKILNLSYKKCRDPFPQAQVKSSWTRQRDSRFEESFSMRQEKRTQKRWGNDNVEKVVAYFWILLSIAFHVVDHVAPGNFQWSTVSRRRNFAKTTELNFSAPKKWYGNRFHGHVGVPWICQNSVGWPCEAWLLPRD